MKELLAGFAVDIFRPVVTLVVPGFWALAPWVVALFLCYPSSWVFANAHPNGIGIAIVLAGTTAGLIFEDLGVRLEDHFFKRFGYTYESWTAYLKRTETTEAIGIRYIRTLVLRLKFEQGMAVSGPFALAGVLVTPMSSLGLKLSLTALVIVVTWYLAYEARCSVKLLEETRVRLA
jgi:hypothetical protein